jgi:hypothetical protein
MSERATKKYMTSRVMRRTVTVAGTVVGSVVLLTGTLGLMSGTASAVPANTLYVTPGGSAGGNCASPATACANINYALSQAVAGDTIKVAAGTYDQTVAITIPVRLVGSGAGRTIINGAGIDPGGSYYGVLYVGTTGGAVSVNGFTFTNPYPYAYTGGEPEVVALADQNADDSVAITSDIISEGSSDPDADSDFPIGIDTFKNSATTTITDDTINGTFQGALLEDNGPVSFAHNKIKSLIAVTYDATTYPPEGLFFLSDLAGSLTGQNATSNKFLRYAGYGIIMEAGYSNGNCSDTPCNGSLSGTLSNNHFALGGASGAAAIALQAMNPGNDLTATLTDNRGYVTSPSQAISQQVSAGATLNVTQNGNTIRVRP